MTKRQSSGIERTINPNRADDRPESTGESYGIEQTIGRNRPENLTVSSRRSAGIDRRIFRYRADNSTVSCWWNFCFLLVELLFSPSGTFIFCW